MEEFTTVYEYSASQPDTAWMLGLIFVFLSGIWTLANYRIHDTILNWNSASGAVILAFSLYWTISVYNIQSDAKQKALYALRNQQHKHVEGVIENFDPMPSGGHKYESFTVAGIPFNYSDFVHVEGFNRTRSHGGPIRGNGDSVRINYYTHEKENFIIRLDIKYLPDSTHK